MAARSIGRLERYRSRRYCGGFRLTFEAGESSMVRMKKSFASARYTRLLVLIAGLVLTLSAVRAQEPPKETGAFRTPDLVELVKLDRTIKLDIRYATSNNFLGRPVYKEARAFLQRPAAEALVRVNFALRKKGYGLIIHDGYRPWSVTKIFWDATPEDKKQFVADPTKGSRHNRGCAVDLSLFDLKTGQEVKMPSEYDEMTRLLYSIVASKSPALTEA